MKRAVLVFMALCVMMAACSPKAAQPVGMGEKEFRELSGVGNWLMADARWTAREIVNEPPPMDDLLINALADPFSNEADWVNADQKELRMQMADRLDVWWAKAKGASNSDLDDSSVVSQFGVAIGARVLRSRLMELSGDLTGAFNMARENWMLSKAAFESAPGYSARELMPTLMIAVESISHLSRNPGINSELKRAVLKDLDFNFVAVTAGRNWDGFYYIGIPQILAQCNSGDVLPDLALSIDPMDEGVTALEKLRAALGDKKSADPKIVAKAFNDQFNRRTTAPSVFNEFANRVNSMTQELTESWGIDIYQTRPEDWDIEKMKAALAKANHPIEELVVYDLARRTFATTESSYIAQARLDAARIRIAAEIEKQVHGKYPESLQSLQKAGYLYQMIDYATNHEYEVDFKNWILKTSQPNVDSRFIFMNQLISSGESI